MLEHFERGGWRLGRNRHRRRHREPECTPRNNGLDFEEEVKSLVTVNEALVIISFLRLGFIKLAICHGAELVPVFAFGENDVRALWRPHSMC